MKKTLAFLFFISIIFTQAQDLNQFDAKGKKDGKWKLYYDQYWAPVKDTSKAVSYWYTYYENGYRIYTEATWGPKGYTLKDSVLSNQEGKIKLLDGKYTWYNKKGNISSEHYFVKGEPIWCKQYHPNGKLYLYFDYLKKHGGEPLSWSLFIYDKKGVLKYESPIVRDKKGHYTSIW